MSEFSAELKDKINGFLTRYETKRSAILPVLHAIQDELGWIKGSHMDALESEFGLSKVHVREVATFYSMYRLKEPKKFRVLFCDNLVCHMMGARDAMEKIRGRIKAYEEKHGESPVSLEGVPCLGVCDGAPAMLVNKERHLKVTDENVLEILDKYAPI